VSISVRAHTPGFHRRGRVITLHISFACECALLGSGPLLWGIVTSISVSSEESFTVLRSDRERGAGSLHRHIKYFSKLDTSY
jgi:hypothetical protein